MGTVDLPVSERVHSSSVKFISMSMKREKRTKTDPSANFKNVVKKRLTCQMKLLLIPNSSNSASNSASISLISCVHIPVIYGTFEASQVVPQKSGSLKSCHVHQVHLRTGGIPLPKVFVDFDIINVHDRHANLAEKNTMKMDGCIWIGG